MVFPSSRSLLLVVFGWPFDFFLDRKLKSKIALNIPRFPFDLSSVNTQLQIHKINMHKNGIVEVNSSDFLHGARWLDHILLGISVGASYQKCSNSLSGCDLIYIVMSQQCCILLQGD